MLYELTTIAETSNSEVIKKAKGFKILNENLLNESNSLIMSIDYATLVILVKILKKYKVKQKILVRSKALK